MLSVLIIFSSLLSVVLLIFILFVNKDDLTMAAYVTVYDLYKKIEKLQYNDKLLKEKRKSYSTFRYTIANIFKKDDSTKEINKLHRKSEKIKNGNFSSISIFFLVGYAVLRKIDYIQYNRLYNKAVSISVEIHGRKFGKQKANQLFATILSMLIVSMTFVLLLSSSLFLSGNTDKGSTILIFGLCLSFVVSYAFYDEATTNVNKRRDAILRQVPQVLSKLALLVTSGMSLNKAWKETAYSKNAEMYLEMQKSCEEIENLISPEAAFSNFALRCNTKETTKLATSLIQSTTKGNKELGILLKGMASDAWLERKSMAKKDSEVANGKLLIPTLLLFIMIIIMIMVPITSSFSSI